MMASFPPQQRRSNDASVAARPRWPQQRRQLPPQTISTLTDSLSDGTKQGAAHAKSALAGWSTTQLVLLALVVVFGVALLGCAAWWCAGFKRRRKQRRRLGRSRAVSPSLVDAAAAANGETESMVQYDVVEAKRARADGSHQLHHQGYHHQQPHHGPVTTTAGGYGYGYAI
ncbi:uncharacterized protein PFL1_06254 [Pseudozyma flocculosa PF-1]|uniref:Uncharacterized protein n=1 Tax=Pseudozyma flocculosa PF-1 TaxID=1277687 RepID=A0A061H286_9BASI|nr:uncharacterized protein PFL1_06254 [Pseudozyma flocculosa PF-1]EPQ26319.1 hypothetical protein PFL1_06254 [Pseudozyma flocculosa PF-1]